MNETSLQSAEHAALTILCAVISLGGGSIFLGIIAKGPALTQQLFTWLSHQITTVKNATAQTLLNRALAIVSQVVLQFENTEIESLKTQLASGAITPAMLPNLLVTIKNNAVAAVQSHITAMGIMNDLLSICFGGNQTGLTSWISTAIEAAVAQLPASGLQTTKAPGVLSSVEQFAKKVIGVPAAPAPVAAPAVAAPAGP